MKTLLSAQFLVVIAVTSALTGCLVTFGVPGAEAGKPAAQAAAPQSAAPSVSKVQAATEFQPPAESSLADDDFGKMVRQGKDIFVHTDTALPQYVGSHLTCSNCHLDAGTKANAGPMWSAYGLYPQYRNKNHHVNTFNERLQDCFRFAMNGKKPPADDPALVALETYSYWLAKGAPIGVKLKGQGFLKLDRPELPPAYVRGEAVYAHDCAACHKADGSGGALGALNVPAVWGNDSYNWGAGMQEVHNAAGFIKANMPLGQGYSLSDQDAWDVALYIDSQERPQDPRFTGSVEETRTLFHDSADSMYGLKVNGHVLGSDSTPAGGRLTAEGRP